MTVASVVLTYKPRGKFLPFHRRKQARAVIVAHRRAGKTYCVVHDVVNRALHINTTRRPNPKYAYIAPYRSQAKDIAWIIFKDAVRDIPGCKISETELSITLPNTAVIKLYGADNAEAIRGGYFDGVVFDEFGDIAGSVWSEIVSPMLGDRNGWVVFMGTPKGKNAFYRMVQKAGALPDQYFFLSLKASESGHLPQDFLDERKEEMEPDEYAREYECSFDASIKGSYYGTHIAALLQRTSEIDQAVPVHYDHLEPVELAMDIGRNDATAIWFWQVIEGEVRFIDYFEETGWDAEDLVDMLQLKPYSYQTWWVPHDALHETFATKKSVIDTFRSYDAPARKVPKPDAGNRIFHGVDVVRKTLKTYPLRFDLLRCSRGVEALKSYSRKWNPDTGMYADSPNHDQWSHGADAFRYACQVINPGTLQASKERAAEKRAAQARNRDNVNALAAINIPKWTINDAWRVHEDALSRQQNDWRQR